MVRKASKESRMVGEEGVDDGALPDQAFGPLEKDDGHGEVASDDGVEEYEGAEC